MKCCGHSQHCRQARVDLVHSQGKMPKGWAGGIPIASRDPEAADRGPQAASRSLMVLLGETPCKAFLSLPLALWPLLPYTATWRSNEASDAFIC